MAKVTRSVLKEMVKECLVEILSEGLVHTAENLHENKSTRRSKRSNKSNKVEEQVFHDRKKMLRERTESKQAAMKARVNNITADPLMQDILADTAATTFQDQPLSESTGAKRGYVPGDGAAKVVYDNELEDLFEGSQNWADLAFSGGKK